MKKFQNIALLRAKVYSVTSWYSGERDEDLISSRKEALREIESAITAIEQFEGKLDEELMTSLNELHKLKNRIEKLETA